MNQITMQPRRSGKTTAKKSAARKAAPKLKSPAKPLHPLMLNHQSWDKDRVMTIVCDQLATSSLGIGSILKNGHQGNTLPSFSTFFAWMDADKSLSDKYARGKEAQADFMADEMLDIADDGRNDWMESLDKDGVPVGYKINGDHVQRSKLRIETRKWLASKLKPKKYGEKLDIQQTVTNADLTDEELDRRLAEKLAALNGK